MAESQHVFETFHQPGRYWTTDEKARLRRELRHVGQAALGSVPDYQCFSESPSAFDDKVMVIAREGGPTGRIIGFVSCILLEIDDIGTVLHTGLTCVLPQKRRQGVQKQLFTRLHKLLCTHYPLGIWFTSVSSSLASLVSLFLATANVFPSPKVRTPSDTHRRIAQAVSLHYRTEIDVADDVVFDPERFIFYSSPDSVWYKDPTDKNYHHRNKTINDYYVEQLSQVPGSEVLQVGFMDPTLYLRIGDTSIRVGHASTGHLILASLTELYTLVSRMKSLFSYGRILECGLRNTRLWFLRQMEIMIHS